MDGNAPLTHRRARRLLATLTGLAAIVLTTLSTGASADEVADPAARWPDGGPAIRAAMAIAEDQWGIAPCHGDVTIAWEDLDPSLDAQAAWANPAGAYADPMRNSECEISLNPRGEWSWPKLCTIVVHESGHLAGRVHVDDPDDVMYYTFMRPIPACAGTPDPTPEAPVAPTAPAPAPATTPKPAGGASTRPAGARSSSAVTARRRGAAARRHHHRRTAGHRRTAARAKARAHRRAAHRS
ncbi:MAG TPA: hypothetical protein VFT50_07625 [Baekduia sp.]|nr:hypothetical protein [Baekduia sp.]